MNDPLDWMGDGVDQPPPTYCKLEGHEWEQIWDDGVGVRCCVCIHCGEEQIFESEEEVSEPAHEGFYMDVDGEPAHFLADANMSPETEEALKGLVRHVRKLLDEGWKPGDKHGKGDKEANGNNS